MANKQRDFAKESRWRDILKRHAASGLPVRAFCQQEQVTEPTFYAWRRTISERDDKAKSQSCRGVRSKCLASDGTGIFPLGVSITSNEGDFHEQQE